MGYKAKRTIMTSRMWPWAAVIVLWGLAFTLSCRGTSTTSHLSIREDGTSIAAAVLSESRIALCGYFYEMADNYFHLGIRHIRARAFEDDPYQIVARKISPEMHVHLQGQDIKEIMPWLRLAMQMNPDNKDVYLVAAFWLAHEARRPDLAMTILDEAQRHVPHCYEVQIEKGRLFLAQENRQAAKRAFDAGLAFWEHQDHDNLEDASYEKARLLLYRALVCEADGETGEAIRSLEGILVLFPERTRIADRIAVLRKDETPVVNAMDFWRTVVKQEDEARATCPREDEHSNHDEHRNHSH